MKLLEDFTLHNRILNVLNRFKWRSLLSSSFIAALIITGERCKQVSISKFNLKQQTLHSSTF